MPGAAAPGFLLRLGVLYLRCATAYPALRDKPQIREIVRRIGVPEMTQ